jgi:hypothetical protein
MRVILEELAQQPQPETAEPAELPASSDQEDFKVDYEETDRLLQLVNKKGKAGHDASLGKRQEPVAEDSEDRRADRLKLNKRKPTAQLQPIAPAPLLPPHLKPILPAPVPKKPTQAFAKDMIRALVLEDRLEQQECIAKCEEAVLDMLAFIVKQRYTGTEYFKFPYKNKVISSKNNKINFKMSNEKKCLPDAWKLVVEEVRRAKNLSADPSRQTIELFLLYFQNKNEALRQKYPQQLRGLSKDEELNMLVCLYGEEYLDLPA